MGKKWQEELDNDKPEETNRINMGRSILRDQYSQVELQLFVKYIIERKLIQLFK